MGPDNSIKTSSGFVNRWGLILSAPGVSFTDYHRVFMS